MMKSKAILVSLVAIFAVLAFTVFASAKTLDVSISTTVSGVDLSEPGVPNIALDVRDSVSVKVVLQSSEQITNARVIVSILGEDLEVETGEFDMLVNRTYSKTLTLTLPSDLEVTPSDAFNMRVSVDAREGSKEANYAFTVQRESYSLDILSVETARSVTAGASFGVNVVLKNRGSHNLEDTFVTVRIPALDIERRAYFSDLSPVDECDDDCDSVDAVERTLFLQIPSDAKAGVYTLEVEASNDDVVSRATKTVTVTGSEQRSDVLVPSSSKEIKAGETATFDLLIVNSGDRIAVYDIVPETAQNLILSVDDSIVTVPADSSKIVKVRAQAGEVMGTFNFAVNVNSQDKLVKRANLSVVVGKKAIASNVMILTVVLAIIFIVLLVVLIVLLTRKPAKSEEFGESYY